MSKLGARALEKPTGGRRLRAEVNSITGGKVAAQVENTAVGENSSNFQPPASKPTPRGRNHKKRDALSRDDALEILKSALAKCQEVGINLAVVELKREKSALGIVLESVFACTKCGNYIFGEKSANGRCNGCDN